MKVKSWVGSFSDIKPSAGVNQTQNHGQTQGLSFTKLQASPDQPWPGVEPAVRRSPSSTLRVNTTSLDPCCSWENWGQGEIKQYWSR